MRRFVLILAIGVAFLFVSLAGYADRKGQGGVILEEEAPLYKSPTSQEVVGVLKKGHPVAAMRSAMLAILGSGQYIFDEKNGRVQVRFFPGDDPSRGKFYDAWVDPAKISKFFYDCSCSNGGKSDCDPIEVRGLRFSFIWNSCFLEAWERKKTELASQQPNTQPPSAEKQESVEERLKKLEDYFKRGIITKEEYDKKRAELLSKL